MPTITEPQVYLKNKVEEQSFGKYRVGRACLRLRWRKARVQRIGSFLLVEHHWFHWLGYWLGKEKILRCCGAEIPLQGLATSFKKRFPLFVHTLWPKSYGWKMMSPDSSKHFPENWQKLSIFLYCYLLLSFLCERTVHIL